MSEERTDDRQLIIALVDQRTGKCISVRATDLGCDPFSNRIKHVLTHYSKDG